VEPFGSGPEFVFPVIPSSYAALLANVLAQLRASERLAPEELERRQFAQLSILMEHAFVQAPFWSERLAAAGWQPGQRADHATLDRLPPLTRADLQTRFEDMRIMHLPARFGPVRLLESSGSTGTAVRVAKCAKQNLLQHAITMRDQLWHERDFSQKLCVLGRAPGRREQPNWGPPMASLLRTGPAAYLDTVRTPLEEQLDWLIAHQPAYVSAPGGRSYMLAELALRRKQKLQLREIMTYGTTLTPAMREVIREAFGAKLTDGYSAEEAGYIAYQCPVHAHYHVHAETVIVEISGEDGHAVPRGEPGHVLITVLHSFAMPLIRYRVGDMAIASGQCDCGRTLPVLAQILGRELTTLKLPNGTMKQVVLVAREFSKYWPVRDFRVLMYEDGVADVLVVADQPVSKMAQDNIVRMVQNELGYPFPMSFKQVPAIDWGQSWKREAFLRINRRSSEQDRPH
jgi:phenylacetate-coenzyme A ligase PaaK-like adenylate-forming protein